MPITVPSAGVASVIHPTTYGVDITLPFSIMYIQNVLARDVGVSSRTQLFAEILGLFNAEPGGVPVDAPSAREVALNAYPNPFNPVTVVKFTARIGSKGTVKIFNLRRKYVGDQKLDDLRDFRKELDRSQYDEARLLELWQSLHSYVTVNETRAKLWKKRLYKVVGVKAKGKADWDGTIDLKRDRTSAQAQRNTAKVVRIATDAPVSRPNDCSDVIGSR